MPKKSETKPETSVAVSEIAEAFKSALEAAKPPVKKNTFNRVAQTPWTPTDGSTKLKLRRKMYQHGIDLKESFLTNEQITLLNKVRPGIYCDGVVHVRKRNDKGIDIDYSVKSVAQRLRLVNQFGVRNLNDLLERLIAEAAAPKRTVDEYDS